MTIEELLAYLTGQAQPPGSHPVDMSVADVLWPVSR